MQSHILTVTQLTRMIKDLLEGSLPELWVDGEISNLSTPQSGHIYFTLKDRQSQVRAVLFRSSQRHLKFTLEQGMQVICRGRLGVYELRGEYQLVVDYAEPKGIGALQRAYEQLKDRLQKEGLFDEQRKKPLPKLPQRIGVVTSPTGAALRDILHVINRRHPRLEVLIYPVPVQGVEAAPAIVEAIEHLNDMNAVDVMIVGRGGGSLEDLWAFNEETVARAIAASRIPVISAVGHETDFTIADFVSDLRAPTPSAAAELVVESEAHLRAEVRALRSRLVLSMRRDVDMRRSAVEHAMRLLGDPRRRFSQIGQRVDELEERLAKGVKLSVARSRDRLRGYAAALDHLNPLGILARGYSVTRKLTDGSIVKTAADVAEGDLISSDLRSGTLVSRVERKVLP